MGELINFHDYVMTHCVGLSCPYHKEKTVVWDFQGVNIILCEECVLLAHYDRGEPCEPSS